MKPTQLPLLGLLFTGAFFAACGPTISPQMVSWQRGASVITPASTPAAPVGALRVETDTDLKEIGGQTFFNIRRPYRVYAADGTLVRRVDNRGGSEGEEPVIAKLPPGRYTVATMYGTDYRRVEVEVENGQVTNVSEDMLRNAAPVFTQVGSR
jgi:hypothetical protein